MKHIKVFAISALLLSSNSGAQSNFPNYRDADSRLNATYRSLASALTQGGRLKLRNEQRAWIASRNRLCGKEAQNSCSTRMTNARETELQHLAMRSTPQSGQCFSTSVMKVGPRMDNDPDGLSGTSVNYRDGHYQVIPEPPKDVGLKIGDPVRLCVVHDQCPPGTSSATTYKTINLRSHRAFTAADTWHDCAGG